MCFSGTALSVSLSPHPQRTPLTWGLKVECYKLAATDPHGQRIIVGGVQPLALRVDARELQPVVLEELLAFGLVHILLSLSFRKGGHVPVTSTFCANL